MRVGWLSGYYSFSAHCGPAVQGAPRNEGVRSQEGGWLSAGQKQRLVVDAEQGAFVEVLCGRSLAFDSKEKTKKATTEAKLGQNRQSKESSRPFPSTQTHWD